MTLLLDNHTYLWWLVADRQPSKRARTTIADAGSVVYISAATIWELAIKVALGRLDVGRVDLVAEIAANGFLELPVSARHADTAGRLPRHHDDPFDRLLVAQAQHEGLTIVTRDPAVPGYGVATLW